MSSEPPCEGLDQEDEKHQRGQTAIANQEYPQERSEEKLDCPPLPEDGDDICTSGNRDIDSRDAVRATIGNKQMNETTPGNQNKVCGGKPECEHRPVVLCCIAREQGGELGAKVHWNRASMSG